MRRVVYTHNTGVLNKPSGFFCSPKLLFVKQSYSQKGGSCGLELLGALVHIYIYIRMYDIVVILAGPDRAESGSCSCEEE